MCVVPDKPYTRTIPYNSIAELIALSIKSLMPDSVDLESLPKAAKATSGRAVSSKDTYIDMSSVVEASSIMPVAENIRSA